MSGGVVVLSGGVGGAKLVVGLSHLCTSNRLLVACNTGDDFVHLGLRVCPDIDSVLYALSGLSDQERGWGRRDETWAFMSALRGLNGPSWFNLGDSDLATHVLRTDLLHQGHTLSDVTLNLAKRMGVAAAIVPMSNDPVATIVETHAGDLGFQHYFVKEQCAPVVNGFRFRGVDCAVPEPQFQQALQNSPDAILIAPSNPYVSVDPILNITGLRDLILQSDAPVVAVSPIVGGRALKGPAAKMMRELGRDVSAFGIATHYQGLIDGLVIDTQDARFVDDIEALGIAVCVTQTVMTDRQSRIALAEATLEFSRSIAR